MLLLKLDAKGICVSTGSACNSGNTYPSHVLLAIKTPLEYINGSIRTTFGEHNTREDVDYLIDNIEKSINELRK